MDVSQEVIVRESDCFAARGEKVRGITVQEITIGNQVIESLEDRLLGRVAAEDIVDPTTGEIIVALNETITNDQAKAIARASIKKAQVRSVLTCRNETGVCARCYGANLATGGAVDVGEAVGIIAAQAIGLNLTKYKLMAFVTSAALAGAAGALYGLNYSSLQATKFNFNLSILVLVFVVLGGLGNIWGSLVAAAALTILPEALRQFADFRMLIYAIVLIFVMLATNNPQAKAFFQKLLPHHRASAEKED